jgi:pimeloyl-ACP methyl ester carboxylesterase
MQVDAEEIVLNLPNRSIAALAWGPKNGKPILALHGWLDNAASFIPLAPYLKDFRVIAIDFPGHGLSSHLPDGIYFHFVDYVADVVNIIDYLGLEKCAILGHSLGAGIATLVAGVFPERITALGLIDGIGPISVTEQQMPEMMGKAITEYAHLPKKKLTIYKNAEEASQARLKASTMKISSVNLLVARGLKAVDQGFVWRTDPRLLCKPLVMFTEAQIAPFLSKISSKTCLLRPSPGWPFDEKLFTARINYLQNIEVHRIKGEHHIHMDEPEIVGPLLHEFFTRVLS